MEEGIDDGHGEGKGGREGFIEFTLKLELARGGLNCCITLH